MSRRPFAAALAGAALVSTAARVSPGQGSVTVQGVADAELWQSDSGSVLLTRNNGHAAALGRVHLWGAADLGRGFVVYAATTAETGRARGEPGTEVYVDLAGVRFSRSEALVFDAGKLTHPVGAFAVRRYSNRNPLIGIPDGYPVQYPLGVQLSGAHGRVDYRAALVSLPIWREGYTPEPTPAAHPAFGFGYTPTTGIRVGASGTWGPYLDRATPSTLLAGKDWCDYAERVGALDAQISRGYLELRGELGAARYQIPGRSETVHGITYYGEAKYTFSPRIFAAGRVERNDYAFIKPISATAWVANPTDMYNAEVGAGYRLTAHTLMKASVRADRWKVPPQLRSILGNGKALALQFSRSFDVFDAALGSR